jgi:methylmalonyl-CoA/ethylmalonyl-CoA epimerase|tara:strand:+ start:352 stop:759 length:408 start_codon:yes stop_codon:yes gene_type:complete
MPTVNSIHHINFVVRELAPQIEYLRTLLQSEPIIEDLPNRQVKTARFCLSGVWLVLVQPLSTEGEVAQILAERGEGLFLLSLNVDSLDASLEKLSQQGINSDNKGKREGLDNWRVQDLDCPNALGPILQLCQLIS